ncbi:restriction endonuclease subunit S [Winogradskyella psychrotolerans]|uniref:restriction endonuclease subunit S n=1 Tax=Winogradskyella psychrotolerans TaxID=1344585 RepID=UPI001C0732B3|nr:restriction endonuclease subunit S [Winogradskyella psychrotolerans]MBU2921495.1 restriction endonuclease subunit S [Winogradskyella psychrotolerans]
MQEEKQLLPELRFPEFEEIWKQKKLGEICKIQTGNKDTQDKEENGLYPFYVRSNTIESINSYSFDEQAILTSGDGAGVGKIYHLVDGKFDLHQRVYALTNFDSNFSIRYTYHFFSEKFYKRVMRLSAKNSVDSVRRDMIFDMKMPYPNKEEQQKIANFLTAIDTQIQTLEKKKNLLEQYKKGVMQKIFKQELRFKDEDGNDFAEWKKKKLGDLTYKVGKKNKENIQYPIYSINNQEGFRPQSEQFDGLDSNERGYDISMYKIVYEKTFAYNPARINVGSIGYSYDLNEVIISSLYVCFKTNEELEDLYLLAYLDTDRFNKDILRYQEGGVRQYLFYENFSQIKIPLPSNEEQTKIANFLSALDKNIALVNTKIEKTKAYKKGLLQQMFV